MRTLIRMIEMSLPSMSVLFVELSLLLFRMLQYAMDVPHSDTCSFSFLVFSISIMSVCLVSTFLWSLLQSQNQRMWREAFISCVLFSLYCFTLHHNTFVCLGLSSPVAYTVCASGLIFLSSLTVLLTTIARCLYHVALKKTVQMKRTA